MADLYTDETEEERKKRLAGETRPRRVRPAEDDTDKIWRLGDPSQSKAVEPTDSTVEPTARTPTQQDTLPPRIQAQQPDTGSAVPPRRLRSVDRPTAYPEEIPIGREQGETSIDYELRRRDEGLRRMEGDKMGRRSVTVTPTGVELGAEKRPSRIRAAGEMARRGAASGGEAGIGGMAGGALVGGLMGLLMPKRYAKIQRTEDIAKAQGEEAQLLARRKSNIEAQEKTADVESKQTESALRRAQTIKTLRTPTHPPQLKVNKQTGLLERVNLDDGISEPIISKATGKPFQAQPDSTYHYGANGVVYETTPGQPPKVIHDERKEYTIGGSKLKLTDEQYAHHLEQLALAQRQATEKDREDAGKGTEATTKRLAAEGELKAAQEELADINTQVTNRRTKIGALKDADPMDPAYNNLNSELHEFEQRARELRSDIRKHQGAINGAKAEENRYNKAPRVSSGRGKVPAKTKIDAQLQNLGIQ